MATSLPRAAATADTLPTEAFRVASKLVKAAANSQTPDALDKAIASLHQVTSRRARFRAAAFLPDSIGMLLTAVETTDAQKGPLHRDFVLGCLDVLGVWVAAVRAAGGSITQQQFSFAQRHTEIVIRLLNPSNPSRTHTQFNDSSTSDKESSEKDKQNAETADSINGNLTPSVYPPLQWQAATAAGYLFGLTSTILSTKLGAAVQTWLERDTCSFRGMQSASMQRCIVSVCLLAAQTQDTDTSTSLVNAIFATGRRSIVWTKEQQTVAMQSGIAGLIRMQSTVYIAHAVVLSFIAGFKSLFHAAVMKPTEATKSNWVRGVCSVCIEAATEPQRHSSDAQSLLCLSWDLRLVGVAACAGLLKGLSTRQGSTNDDIDWSTTTLIEIIASTVTSPPMPAMPLDDSVIDGAIYRNGLSRDLCAVAMFECADAIADRVAVFNACMHLLFETALGAVNGPDDVDGAGGSGTMGSLKNIAAKSIIQCVESPLFSRVSDLCRCLSKLATATEDAACVRAERCTILVTRLVMQGRITMDIATVVRVERKRLAKGGITDGGNTDSVFDVDASRLYLGTCFLTTTMLLQPLYDTMAPALVVEAIVACAYHYHSAIPVAVKKLVPTLVGLVEKLDDNALRQLCTRLPSPESIVRLAFTRETTTATTGGGDGGDGDIEGTDGDGTYVHVALGQSAGLILRILSHHTIWIRVHHDDQLQIVAPLMFQLMRSMPASRNADAHSLMETIIIANNGKEGDDDGGGENMGGADRGDDHSGHSLALKILPLYLKVGITEGFPLHTSLASLARIVIAIMITFPATSHTLLTIHCLEARSLELKSLQLTRVMTAVIEEIDHVLLADLLDAISRVVMGLPVAAQSAALKHAFEVAHTRVDVLRQMQVVEWYMRLAKDCADVHLKQRSKL